MAKHGKKKIVSRKYLARVERERILRRYIIIGTATVTIIALLLVGYGIVNDLVLKPRTPIVEVNDEVVTTAQFQALIRFQRVNLVNQFNSYFNFVQGLGDPGMISSFLPYLTQIENQLQPESIGVSALNNLIEDALIRQEARKLGIQVSQEEIQKYIAESVFFYYPDGTPTPTPTTEVRPTSTLSPLQMTLVPSKAITETADLAPTPTPEEGTEPTPTTPPPTPTPYTREKYEADYKDYLSTLQTFAKLSEQDIFWIMEGLVLREKVMDIVVTDVPTEEERLWARHILFLDEETGEEQAREFLARLNNGEEFLTVAEELTANQSEDDSNIIFEDLGWFGKGAMVEPFEEAAYALQVGEISEPVQTPFGWHIIQVLGREVQPLDPYEIQQRRLQAFEEWLLALRTEAQIDIAEDWLPLVPDEPDIPPQYKEFLNQIAPTVQP